jgi:hypothetical protein
MEFDVIDHPACVIRLLPNPKPAAGFYDFDEYERLIAAAKALDRAAHLIVLLGGGAGLAAARSWRSSGAMSTCTNGSCACGGPTGTVTSPCPRAGRLATALRGYRHLRSDRVLCLPPGAALSADIVKHHVERAARRAHIGQSGVHRVRHTFCPHLAIRGAPARAIQGLGTSGSQHDAALHAPESGGDRRRDPTAGTSRIRFLRVETFWRQRMRDPLSPFC